MASNELSMGWRNNPPAKHEPHAKVGGSTTCNQRKGDLTAKCLQWQRHWRTATTKYADIFQIVQKPRLARPGLRIILRASSTVITVGYCRALLRSSNSRNIERSTSNSETLKRKGAGGRVRAAHGLQGGTGKATTRYNPPLDRAAA